MSDSGALRLSWSRLRLHDECPAKWGLQRSAKSPYQDIRNFFHGNVCDLAMRRWLEQPEPEPGWMAVQVEAIFAEAEVIAKDTGDGIVKWKHATDKRETMEFCRELVRRLEEDLTEHVLPYEWEPAVRFSVPIGVTGLDGEVREVDLIGEMDLLVRKPATGAYVIWDLKATANNSYYQKVLGQLAFYTIALKAWKKQWPEHTGLLQPMCDERVLPVMVDKDARAQMAGRIVKTANDIWAGNLAPKADNAGCTYCEVQRACPKFDIKPGRGAMRRAAA